MKPYYKDDLITIYNGNCLDVLSAISNISAVVTDPPYGIGFMAKEWDDFADTTNSAFGKQSPANKNNNNKVFKTRGKPIAGWCEKDRESIREYQKFSQQWSTMTLKCVKPGAIALVFGGTRTFHRLCCGIEDGGWQIRDTLMWIYGSGFPKSLDIGKSIDKVQGNKREIVGDNPNHRPVSGVNYQGIYAGGNTGAKDLTRGDTVWEGYGTALKPAYEPIILAMNPLDGTFANNALKHGVAGLNIDGCRVPVDVVADASQIRIMNRSQRCEDISGQKWDMSKLSSDNTQVVSADGRFPANLIHDGSEEVLELFPVSKDGVAVGRNASAGKVYGGGKGLISQEKGSERCGYGGSGSAARFFYCAKASKSERREGNTHPTVKPLALMEYLVKLVKMPEYNLILDPFMGSGTTLLACKKLGIECIGIELDEKYCEIAVNRLKGIK